MGLKRLPSARLPAVRLVSIDRFDNVYQNEILFIPKTYKTRAYRSYSRTVAHTKDACFLPTRLVRSRRSPTAHKSSINNRVNGELLSSGWLGGHRSSRPVSVSSRGPDFSFFSLPLPFPGKLVECDDLRRRRRPR